MANFRVSVRSEEIGDFMKNLFVTIVLLMSPFAFADYQLVCRQKLSSTQQRIDSFTLRGATQNFQQSRQVIYVSQISQIPTNPYASVSNQDQSKDTPFERAEYSVLRVQSSFNQDSFSIDLNGGGSLSFQFNFISKLWDGHFVRPNGPELVQIFSSCTLDNPEIGFTARN